MKDKILLFYLKNILLIFLFINVLIVNSKIVLASNTVINKQAEMLNISSFLDLAEENTSEVFGDISYTEVFNNLIQGKTDISYIFPSIISLFKDEIKNVLKIIFTIFVVIIIHSVFKSISENLGNESVGKIAYFVQYIVIVILVMETYSDVVIYVKNTIERLVDYTYILIPILMTLMISTGNITAVSTIEPIILFAITFIGKIIVNFLIPILLIGTVLSIISNISPQISIDKISKYFKSSIVWVLGFILTIFTGILSLQSVLTKGVDEITVKATKNIVSTAVPVVGKVLSDTTETVLGCAVILKNSIGIIGIIVIIGICIVPLLKILLFMIGYYITGGLCEIVADEKIVKVITQMGDTFKILLGMLLAVMAMLIIGSTIIVKVTSVT